jgi:hypothetical protein
MATITLRNVPENLRLELAARAARNRRSLSAEIIHALSAQQPERHDPLLDPAFVAWVDSFPMVDQELIDEYRRELRE